MRRLIVSEDIVSGDRIHITDKEDILYISTVLRMTEGGGLLVSNGEGLLREAEIEHVSKSGIELRIISEFPQDDEEKTRVTLYQGLPKGPKMEEIIRKATELGVFRVVPVETARSVPGADDINAAKLERWRRVAKEASKQSRRDRVPEVADVTGLEEAAGGLSAEGYDLALALYELEEGRTLKQALRVLNESIDRILAKALQYYEGDSKPLEIAVFIGPEGGFESAEVERLVRAGAVSVTLGDTILRTETAGPAAIAMILYEMDM